VYVIPPNKNLSILNGTLHLFEAVEPRGLRLPIDFFLRSLAADRQEYSIGIILSGMGSDGSLGIKAIKEKNGAVLIQEPASAKFDSMPRSAADAVMADIVAPAEELPAKLISFLKFIPANETTPELDHKSKSSLDKIIILLREQCDHDFSLYKKNTLLRRIERRRGIHQIDKIQNYVGFLQKNPKEVELLFKELLIGVTNFFRNAAVWDKLQESILPDLLNKLPNGYIFRAWVTACSTGEEAYSLAMVFKEILDKIKQDKKLTLQIFATDLDLDAIETARKGIYPANITSDVSAERLARFFTQHGEKFRVNATIREVVVFAQQNVIKDPPFTKVDLLTCRNMLIYLEPELQNKLFSWFHYSLNPGGIMVLGSAETLGNKNSGFKTLDAKLKIFERTASDAGVDSMNFPNSFSHKKQLPVLKNPAPKPDESLQAITNSILLQHFSPASVLVNNAGDILYISGRTGKYLEPASGKTNWNIHAMARDNLRHELAGAFRKAMQSFDPITVRNIKIESYESIQYVNITVQRLENPEAVSGMIIVVFTDVPAVTEKPAVSNYQTGKRTTNESARQKKLEVELQRRNEDLQSMREEMQTSQEELKSTNEELQSINEELTTSQEELQSLNEELQTVNTELQSKVSDYVQANNDMKNLLNSTEIATLFLDKDLNIRRFTDSAVSVIKLRLSDIGRPFTDLVNDLQYPEIEHHAKQVLKTLTTMESAIATNNNRWFTIRIMPYRTWDDRIDGLVITFTDITAAKKLEIDLKKANMALQKKGGSKNDKGKK
jgi:two-component system CheB/CheR fusion protein